MHANTVITAVRNEETPGKATVTDDGCGCCMSDIKQHQVKTLEKSIKNMKELVEKAETVLENRKELFDEVGHRLSRDSLKEYQPECFECGKHTSNIFRNEFYLVDDVILCKSCVDDEDGLYRDRGTVLV